MEKFSLQHTVLYSKGWYKRYDIRGKRKTIWDDLQVVLEADGYVGTFNGDSEVQKINRITYLLVKQLDRIPKKGYRGTLPDFFESINEYNCWKFGYYTKNNSFWSSRKVDDLPNYDYNEAVAWYCLSFFSLLTKDEFESIKPDSNVLPLSNGVKSKSIKELWGTN